MRNATTLHSVDSGADNDGATLVFLHYFAGSVRAWAGVIARLDMSSRCIALDARGFGGSTVSSNKFSVSEMADDVMATLCGLNVTSYALIGHSMGGKTALAIAARRPAALTALVLLAPSPPTPEPINENERLRLVSSLEDRASAERTAVERVARPLTDEDRGVVVSDALRTSKWAWHGWLECGSREDISRATAGMVTPTLVIAGALDTPLSPDYLDVHVRQRIPSSRLVVVPNAAHLLPFEAPRETATLIHAHCAQSWKRRIDTTGP
ncbi:alpha/beta fold hydrolase [Gemmatimonas sp.]|uniref:alpha/beta fold hydrolase n=1 Tax=Gemmatimonas sp. TaxID=1962908 RepID=UPI0035676AE9